MIHVQPALPARSARTGLLQRLGDACRGARDAYHDWRDSRTLRREIDVLETQHLLDSTLADVGLSRAQLPRLASGMRRHRLFHRMLARLGLESARLGDRAELNEIMWTCASCTAGKACRHWLDSGQVDGYQTFCANAPAFDRLIAQRSAGTAD
ncbi:MAG TPA: DUF6455 family protein [Candidatus Sulfotelmatobacter sp.]|nr:DUF6455 family protein [Candidatus Sulfotelmatobacter sp.]